MMYDENSCKLQKVYLSTTWGLWTLQVRRGGMARASQDHLPHLNLLDMLTTTKCSLKHF
jgi:hypothetical protein